MLLVILLESLATISGLLLTLASEFAILAGILPVEAIAEVASLVPRFVSEFLTAKSLAILVLGVGLRVEAATVLTSFSLLGCI